MKKIALMVGVVLLIINLCSSAFCEELEFMEKAFGTSEEKAVFNAQWAIVAKAMQKAIHDQAQDKETIALIRKSFLENQGRYLHHEKLIYKRKEAGRYAAKVRASVDMAAVRTDAKEVIRGATNKRELPSIAIYTNNKNRDFAGFIVNKFKEYGYVYFDYETQKANYIPKLNKADTSDIGELEFEIIAKNAGVNFLVEIPVSIIRYHGINKVTGGERGSLSFEIKAIDTNSNASEALAYVRDAVQCSTTIGLEDALYAKAAKVVFNQINSQIISSWRDAKTTYTAYFDKMDRKLYRSAVNILIEMTGDDNPNIENDPVAGYKATFKLKKNLKYSDLTSTEDKLLKLGLSDDKYDVQVGNSETQVKKK